MNVLVIGGKRFVGYHIANALLKQDHKVTFFNRGKTNRELFPECENIIGDRNTDLHVLKGKTFDWVIDTCAYFPKQVEELLDVMAGHFSKYVLISTIAVANPSSPNFDESVDVFKPDYTSKEVTMETYGPLKSACEDVVQNRLKEEGIIIRPGYIVGDMDYTHRFSYYPVLMHHRSEIVLPDTGELPYSFVDGKDLGSFVVHALETDRFGIYQTVGPDHLTFKDVVKTCQEVVNPNCNIHYADPTWLEQHDIIIARDYPTCNLDERGHMMFSIDTKKAKQAGFTTRPLADTIQDALHYVLETNQLNDALSVGLSEDRMNELLQKLSQSNQSSFLK
jgi:2'-hydroxyisoflavone reductase